MVGQRPLEPLIQVRILVPEPAKIPLIGRGIFAVGCWYKFWVFLNLTLLRQCFLGRMNKEKNNYVKFFYHREKE